MNSMGSSRIRSYQQFGRVVGTGCGWAPVFFLDHLLDPIRWGGPWHSISVDIFCGPEAHACLSVCVGGGVWVVWEEAGGQPSAPVAGTDPSPN